MKRQSGRVRAGALRSVAVLTIAATLLIDPVVATRLAPSVSAATNAECDSLQTDNEFRARDNNVTINGDANLVAGYINYVNYALCTRGLFTPNQSGSGAWVAIEGPRSNDIVQIGLWKCNTIGLVCGNGMDAGSVDWFYAWGVDGNPFMMPWPNKIALADTGTHEYREGNFNGNWTFFIDGQLKKTISDSFRTWSKTRVQQAVEGWNEGDQLGGTATSHQTFRSVFYETGSVLHYNAFGNPYPAGHCYPWASTTFSNGSDWDVWTSSNHTNC